MIYTTFYDIYLGPHAIWKVDVQDPEFVTLISLPHLHVLNPLLHAQYFQQLPHRWRPGQSETVGVNDKYAVVRSPILVLGTDFESHLKLGPAIVEDASSWSVDNAWQDISKNMARALRYVSKQAQLPKEPAWGLSTGAIKIDFSLEFPKSRPSRNAFFSPYALETAITLERVLEADRIRGQQQPVVAVELLLDAVQSVLELDFRRALLFSAIAMESYAASEIDNSYLALLEGEPSPDHMRVVSFQLPGGRTQKKDPIYAYIAEKTRTDFRALLHEVPLYILNKSLMLENQQLYQKAIRLYKTRNQIVHRGEVLDSPEDVFEFCLPDARAGVQTALDVCSWFGMRENFILPSDERVRLAAPDERGHEFAGVPPQIP